jgi:hypothetical protein
MQANGVVMSKNLILNYQNEEMTRQAEGESMSASYQDFMDRRRPGPCVGFP